MDPVLHTLYFMEAQGYTIEINVMFQDSKSSTRLLINGKQSSTKNGKYISFKYFFFNDVLKRGDLSVRCYPTEDMWAYILTKPIQGKPFQRMRSKLMNMPEIYVKVDHVTPKLVPRKENNATGLALIGASTKTKTI